MVSNEYAFNNVDSILCNICVRGIGCDTGNKTKGKIMARVWENKKLNELQTYDRSYAIQAYKEGYEVYATRGLSSTPNVKDARLYSVDDILNVEGAMFVIKELSIEGIT
jgi:hypothetical protein